MLVLNSFINEDRRRKFSAAATGGGFLPTCDSETWLESKFADERFLRNFELHRADEPSREENISTHDGSLIVASKSVSSRNIEYNLPQCCVAPEVTINNAAESISAFYNAPKESVCRYTLSDF